jgi:formylglycine-generating enzyme required for sulfatase activity/ribosomal protein S18 acetylase RimI-like enzyme
MNSERDSDGHEIVAWGRRELARRSDALAARGLRDFVRHTPPIPPRELTLDCGGGVNMPLVLIPAGAFMMGSPEDEEDPCDAEGPQQEVRIGKPFYLGKYPVTQAQWQAVMRSNPSAFSLYNYLGTEECKIAELFRSKLGGTPSGIGRSYLLTGADTSQHPVEGVSWDDCQEFCRRLSALSGKLVRLPTEAEWEYACRAGNTSKFCFGNDEIQLGEYAWFDKNSEERTHVVGSKRPNAWGLYDMHGNVDEWCASLWRPYHGASAEVVDSFFHFDDGTDRVFRGGSYAELAWSCRSAHRDACLPDGFDRRKGLRVAVEIGDYGIRRATQDDLALVLAWLKDEWDQGGPERGFWCNRNPVVKGEAKGDLSVLVRSGDDIPIGFLLSSEATLDIMEIRPEFRRQGLGWMLAQHGLHRIKEAGEIGLVIECAPMTSVPFWESLGFRHIERPWGNDGSYYASYVFSKRSYMPQGPFVRVLVKLQSSRTWLSRPDQDFKRCAGTTAQNEFMLDRPIVAFVDMGEAIVEVCVGDKLISARKVIDSADVGIEYKSGFMRIDRLFQPNAD